MWSPILVKLVDVCIICLISLYECKSRTPSYRLPELGCHVRLPEHFILSGLAYYSVVYVRHLSLTF
jgi:hypothetical protein